MRYVLSLFVVFLFVPPAFSQSSEEAANKLLVEAIQSFQAAEQASDDGRYKLYLSVRENLDEIVSDYPGSNVAVMILTQRTVGPIDKNDLNRKIEFFSPAAISARHAEAERQRQEEIAQSQKNFEATAGFIEQIEKTQKVARGEWIYFASGKLQLLVYFDGFERATNTFNYVFHAAGAGSFGRHHDYGIDQNGLAGGRGIVHNNGDVTLTDGKSGDNIRLKLVTSDNGSFQSLQNLERNNFMRSDIQLSISGRMSGMSDAIKILYVDAEILGNPGMRPDNFGEVMMSRACPAEDFLPKGNKCLLANPTTGEIEIPNTCWRVYPFGVDLGNSAVEYKVQVNNDEKWVSTREFEKLKQRRKVQTALAFRASSNNEDPYSIYYFFGC